MDIITIGDGMITFNPITKGPLRFVNNFERKIGGAELNVIIGCARLGLQTGWISRLGKDEFGRHILNTVRGEGINIDEVKLMPNYATSLNFKEVQESGDVKTFYYRQKSPTETLTPEKLPEEYIKNAKILHVTGVFPAITLQNRSVILKALEIAKENNVLVSFDPNIRLKLWSKEEARQTILSFLPYVDYLLTGRDELELIFDEKEDVTLLSKIKEYQFKEVIVKCGSNGADYLLNNKWVHEPGFHVEQVVDTVGAGDGFDAGFLYAVLKEWPIDKAVKLANAVGAMVVQVAGDNEGLPYMEDVDAFLGKINIIDR